MKGKLTCMTLVGLMVMAIFIGCVSGPPQEMVKRNDHVGLAAWYEQEATSLRARAQEMRHMAKEYEVRMTKPGQTSDLVRHCQNLVERYTNAAEDAEALANLHREQSKS